MLHRTVVAFMATGILLAGCSSSADQSAGASAEQLLSSAAQGDGTRACEVLSPSTRSELEQSSGKPCAQAILEEDLPSGGLEKVEVFETMAIVHTEPRRCSFPGSTLGGWSSRPHAPP